MAFVNGMEGGEGQFSEASFTAAADRTGEKKLGGAEKGSRAQKEMPRGTRGVGREEGGTPYLRRWEARSLES